MSTDEGDARRVMLFSARLWRLYVYWHAVIVAFSVAFSFADVESLLFEIGIGRLVETVVVGGLLFLPLNVIAIFWALVSAVRTGRVTFVWIALADTTLVILQGMALALASF
jgi:hypothetical protein